MRRGFTLPEVLATMVLIGIVLPVAMAGISTAMQTSARARHQAEASELAHTKLSELTLLTDATQLTGAGTFGDAWREYRWESAGAVHDLDTYTLTVTVFWAERSVERATSLSTIVFIPGTSTSTDTSTGVAP